MLKYGKNIIFNPKHLDPLHIDRQSVEKIPNNARVLEIGCATGFVGEYLKKEKNCTVVGVDIGVDELKEAKKKLDEVILGDIEEEETLKKLRKYKKFDVVYSSALIEHLRDPWIATSEWKNFLKPNGMLILTTSNITHWSMRVKLLKGQFEYEEYGLLDKTHLRFFTPKTFQNLVKNSGYTIQQYTIDSVGGGHPRISKFLSQFFPNVFAFQMLIVASKK